MVDFIGFAVRLNPEQAYVHLQKIESSCGSAKHYRGALETGCGSVRGGLLAIENHAGVIHLTNRVSVLNGDFSANCGSVLSEFDSMMVDT